MSPAGRGRAAAWLALGLVTAVAAAPPAASGPSADERIAFYSARVGGPGTYALRARLGLAYLDKAEATGDPRFRAKAERQLRASLEVQRNFEALLGLATLEAARHRFGRALELATEATAAVPGSPEVAGLVFEIELARGNLAAAEAALERLRGAGESFAALAAEAALSDQRGALDEALRLSERACVRADEEGAAPATRAWCAVRAGGLRLRAHCDADGAETDYAHALAIAPAYFQAREHLAELRAGQGRDAEAYTMYSALLRDVPGHPAWRLARCALDERMGRPRKAARERRRLRARLSREIGAGDREHVREYALLLLDEGTERAVSSAVDLLRAEWSERRDWITADALAWALHRAGRDGQARDLTEALLATGTRDAAAVLHAAQILGKGGEARRAAELAAAAVACPLVLDPDQRAIAAGLIAAR